jgi:cyclopropane fatty-acyl-phospholipid synthase-like methyltransferase
VNSVMGATRYVADALLIKKTVGQNGIVLDLGCGWGQMSYLLKRLNLQVIAADIQKETPYCVDYYNNNFQEDRISYHCCNILEKHPSVLFADKPFDAICLSGVVEHVSDFSLFLNRMRPMLAKHGRLFIFRFPNRYSWIEKINELQFMLRWNGYKVDRSDYEEIFPVNVQGLPDWLIKTYRNTNSMIMPVSKILCKIPILNSLSTSFRVICTKAYDY